MYLIKQKLNIVNSILGTTPRNLSLQRTPNTTDRPDQWTLMFSHPQQQLRSTNRKNTNKGGDIAETLNQHSFIQERKRKLATKVSTWHSVSQHRICMGLDI